MHVLPVNFFILMVNFPPFLFQNSHRQLLRTSRRLQRGIRRRLVHVGVCFAAGQNAEEEEALAMLELSSCWDNYPPCNQAWCAGKWIIYR